MPAKTLEEWPPNRRIRILDTECEHGPCLEIITVECSGVEDLDFGWIRLLKSDDTPWMVDQAHAIDGWGPLFYDLAIEVGSYLGYAIRPHFQNVSVEAHKVWRYYFYKREDVQHFRLPKSIQLAHEVDDKIELACGYYKDLVVFEEVKQKGLLFTP